LKDCFKAFDKDNNGYITREELGQALRQTSIEMSGEELDEMINAVDKNNDGKIGLDGFNYF
jgi:calmodulin